VLDGQNLFPPGFHPFPFFPPRKRDVRSGPTPPRIRSCPRRSAQREPRRYSPSSSLRGLSDLYFFATRVVLQRPFLFFLLEFPVTGEALGQFVICRTRRAARSAAVRTLALSEGPPFFEYLLVARAPRVMPSRMRRNVSGFPLLLSSTFFPLKRDYDVVFSLALRHRDSLHERHCIPLFYFYIPFVFVCSYPGSLSRPFLPSLPEIARGRVRGVYRFSHPL